MELNFNLHEKQMEIFKDPARFKVVAAGRRFGKSYLSAVTLLLEGMKEENEYGMSLKSKQVWYIAPTYQQAKDIMWATLKDLGEPLIKKVHENTATITLINGRQIQLKGSDRPDTLRGPGLSYVVLDEYAFMKPEVWDVIVRPMLNETRGGALFIGTPDGKNHFYDLFVTASNADNWKAFQFKSIDNPIIDHEEIEAARQTMSEAAFRQELEASFSGGGTGAFAPEDFQYDDTNPYGSGGAYIAVDLAGFSETNTMSKSAEANLDETAITIVEVTPKGWFVLDQISGRWGIRETALRIIRACHHYHPMALGIEKGALMNAVEPYLQEYMRRLGVYPRIVPLTHGNKRKIDRIMWALQGRFQHGQITFKRGHWNKKLTDQLLDFPNPLVHDDLVDSLAYIDQLAEVSFVPADEFYESAHEEALLIDPIAGF